MRLVSYMTPGFPVTLFEAFADVAGADLHLEVDTSGPRPGEDPFGSGRYDLGWICATSYVRLALDSEDPSIRLAGVAWVPDDPDADGRPVYFGDLVVRADSPAGDLEHLAGRRIGCNDVDTLSGHQTLRIEIGRRGGDPDTFADLCFTGGHHASLDLLLDGRLDAAIVDSVVRIGRAGVDPRMADLRVIERLGPWPVQPLVASRSLPASTAEVVVHHLLEAASRPPLRDELHRAALIGLVPIDASHYDALHVALA